MSTPPRPARAPARGVGRSATRSRSPGCCPMVVGDHLARPRAASTGSTASEFDDGLLDAIIQTLAYIMMALGLNIVVGFAGLLDLGYVAFFAIGAFVVGWFVSSHFADSETSTSSSPSDATRASTSTSSSRSSSPPRSPRSSA